MLVSDPKRQAFASLRGYAHQLWRSLFAWLQLRDDQVLFVEGAEDFDLATGKEVSLTQVKNTSRSITLESPDVKKAIGRFLQLQEDNPEFALTFRYVTTASATFERSHPFGAEENGIDAWERCRTSGDHGLAENIAAFLLRDINITPIIRSFLELARPSEIFMRLIYPISWCTFSNSTPDIERWVDEYLICHGERRLINPTDSKKIADALLRAMLAAATQANPAERRLTRAKWLEIFEEKTTVRVSLGTYAASITASLHPNSAALLAGQTVSYFSTNTPDLSPGKLPLSISPIIERAALSTKALETIRHDRILCLTGASGSGKTTLAKEIVSKSAKPFLWASLSDSSLTGVLEKLVTLLPAMPTGSLWVLDGLDAIDDRELDRLALFLYSALERGDWVLITRYKALPIKLTTLLTIAKRPEFEVVRLTHDEIATFAKVLGCPDHAAETASRFVELESAGHPQLTHVFLLDMKGRGWSNITPLMRLESPKGVYQAQSEMQASLLRRLSKESTQMICALSLYGSYFRRDQAIGIGEIEGLKIDRPGKVLDELIGPCIESADTDYLRLSPLLADAARTEWSEQRIAMFRADIVEAVLKSGRLTIVEANQIIKVSLLGGIETALLNICTSLLTTPQEHWGVLTSELYWMAQIDSSTLTLSFSHSARHAFYWLQFRIAARIAPHRCSSILNAWESTLQDDTDNPDAPVRFSTMAMFAIIEMSAKLPFQRLVSLLLSIDLYRKASADVAAIMDFVGPRDGDGDGDGDFLSMAFTLIAARCTDAEKLIELTETLKGLQVETRDRLLRTDQSGSSLFINAAWTAEVKKDVPDWDLAIRALRVAEAAGKEWGVPTIQATAAAGIAAVYAEYLGDTEAALACLDQVELDVGRMPIIQDQRAMVYFTQGASEKALSLWDGLLPTWLPITESAPALSSRNAGICAARLGLWSEAATWFREGARRASSALSAWFVPAFEADEGYAFWKEGCYFEAVRSWEASLEGLERLVELEGEGRWARITSKTVGHVLLWCKTYSLQEPTELLAEPLPGMCSNPAKREEIENLIPTPLDLSWLHLCNLEEALLGQSKVFDRLRARLLNSGYLIVRGFSVELCLRKAFRLSALEDLPHQARKYRNSFTAMRKAEERGVSILQPLTVATEKELLIDEEPFDECLLVAGLLAVDDWAAQLLQWRQGLTAEPGAIDKWLEMADNVADAGVITNRSTMRNGSCDRGPRLLAAARVGAETRATPEDLFYAHSLLLAYFLPAIASRFVGTHLGVLVRKGWLRAIESPATLVTPVISIPAIRDACNDESGGFQKAARILLAAAGAVRTPLPGNLRAQMKALALSNAGING